MEEKRELLKRHGTVRNYTEVSADEVLDAIAEGCDIRIRYAIIEGSLVIKDRIEPDERNRRLVRGNIGISSSEIWGPVNFNEVTFKEGVSFTRSDFKRDVYFNEVVFEKGVHFDESNLRGAYFKKAKFEVAGFNCTSFSEVASFMDAVIKSGSFTEVVFEGDVIFIGTIFEVANFIGATFERDVCFNGATFNGYEDFTKFCGASFKRSALFYAATFNNYADFRLATFGLDTDLDKANFTEVPPECFNTVGWAHRRSLLLGASYFFERAAEGYRIQAKYSEASDNFRDAKLEYEKEGEYDKAGEMYISEMETNRLGLKAQGGSLLKRLVLRFLKWSCNYGESPGRFIIWLLAIVLVFAIIYMPIIPNWCGWCPSITFKEYPFHDWGAGIVDGFLFNIGTAIYFSVVTFATLGFGDIAPVSLVGKFWASLEVLSGYLMFGMLITLVVRKITRS